jgi:hypothetical protein
MHTEQQACEKRSKRPIYSQGVFKGREALSSGLRFLHSSNPKRCGTNRTTTIEIQTINGVGRQKSEIPMTNLAEPEQSPEMSTGKQATRSLGFKSIDRLTEERREEPRNYACHLRHNKVQFGRRSQPWKLPSVYRVENTENKNENSPLSQHVETIFLWISNIHQYPNCPSPLPNTLDFLPVPRP